MLEIKMLLKPIVSQQFVFAQDLSLFTRKSFTLPYLPILSSLVIADNILYVYREAHINQ